MNDVDQLKNRRARFEKNVAFDYGGVPRINQIATRSNRQPSGCPKFPLTEEQLRLTGPGGRKLNIRGQFRHDGRAFEQAYCFVHQRWEFNHIETLPQDKRTMRGYDAEQMVRVQHATGRFWLIIGVLLYPLGGFLLINHMIHDGEFARSAMLEVSTRVSNYAINAVHEDEARIADTIELIGLILMGLLVFICLGVCVWALIIHKN